MKIILKKGFTINSFYENIFKNKVFNRENLFGQVNVDFKEVLNSIPVGKNFKALDLGYGYGSYSLALAKNGFKVLAVDFISSKYFRNRIKNKKNSNKIKIVEEDLNSFIPKEKFDFLVAKDVLHFLPKSKLRALLNKLIKSTKRNGRHYIIVFTDIIRESDGVKIMIENEANLTTKNLMDILNESYRGWDVKIKNENYKERDRSGVKGKFYFLANKITVIAKNDYVERI